LKTLNCRGRLVSLDVPKVMGIINITLDSFYDGGKSFSTDQLLRQADAMLAAGATFLDVGGYSSRPGADDISIEKETDRILRAIAAILEEFPESLISVDTFRSSVAEAAIRQGAAIINDISGGSLDPDMFDTVAKLQVPYILMHMRGTPKTMVSLTDYENVTVDVLNDLSEKIGKARAAGINDIIVDPGFGFAKNAAQSFELLEHFELFKTLDTPLLVGVSRKSMIYKTLKITPQEALNGTTALHMIALSKGAHILRVHDVREAVECVKLIEKLRTSSKH